MAKKKEKKEQVIVEAPVIEEAPSKEEKYYVKTFCKCNTPFGVFEKDKFVAVSKEALDHLEEHGIKFERAN